VPTHMPLALPVRGEAMLRTRVRSLLIGRASADGRSASTRLPAWVGCPVKTGCGTGLPVQGWAMLRSLLRRCFALFLRMLWHLPFWLRQGRLEYPISTITKRPGPPHSWAPFPCCSNLVRARLAPPRPLNSAVVCTLAWEVVGRVLQAGCVIRQKNSLRSKPPT
jgi:hypothetical protein